MSLPLNNYRLDAYIASGVTGFEVVIASLRYQAEKLGAKCELFVTDAPVSGLRLRLTAPDCLQSETVLNGWQDNPTREVSEELIQAAAGIMSVHGRSAGGTRGLGVNYASVLSAVMALSGLMATELGQRRGSTASHCQLSMLAAALTSTGQYIADATAGDDFHTVLSGAESTELRPPFVSSDGQAFELEALDAEPWLLFWKTLGVEKASAGHAWKAFQLRYARAIAPLPAELLAAASELPYQQLVQYCAQTGMAICPINSLVDLSQHQCTRDSWEQGPWDFSAQQECKGFLTTQVSNTLPLSGLSVVESCRRIQGPLAGHFLAMLGATVIRLEPPNGDPLRGMPPMINGCSARFDALNRMKLVREINIKTAEGREKIAELITGSDVFLHNWAPHKAAQLQLDYQHLKKLNPALIYGYAGGWGRFIPDGNIPGTDFMAQAFSGVAGEIADSSGLKGGSLFTVLDVLGGAVAAQGVIAGLLQREQKLKACMVETSLLGAANLLCEPVLKDFFTTLTAPPVQPLPSTRIRLFTTLDGEIAVPNDNQLLSVIILGHENIDVSDDELSTQLSLKTSATWLTIFDDAGTPASLVHADLRDIATDPRILPCVRKTSYLEVLSPWRFK